MRWNAPGLSYSRPIRWITALLGEHVVPFSVATLDSGRMTRVHRTAERPVVEVATAGEFLPTLRANGIEPDAAVRRERIVAQAAGLAATAGGAPAQSVLEEVVNLVEEPAILGSFDERYLDLPADVLTTVMRKHQRYLSLSAAGRLLPYFVTVANGACDTGVVRAGNEAVLRARFEDTSFFFAADLRTPPEEMTGGLAALTFEERLGSMADRAGRIRSIAAVLAERVDLAEDERRTLDRAARLAKFDLASHMVIELSGLAGTMAGGTPGAPVSRRRSPRRSRRWSCPARPATPCPSRCPARCSRWPTGSTCSPGCSASAPRRPAARTRTACAAPPWA
jgi:glycyl-tRNA synthetase